MFDFFQVALLGRRLRVDAEPEREVETRTVFRFPTGISLSSGPGSSSIVNWVKPTCGWPGGLFEELFRGVDAAGCGTSV